MASASGVSLVLSGAGEAGWPRGQVEIVRRASLCAALRTQFRAAPAAVSCLHGVPWRADVAACAIALPGPFLALARATGLLIPMQLELFVRRPLCRAGPLAAARHALERVGVPICEDGAWVSTGREILEDPWVASLHVVSYGLYSAGRASEWSRPSCRRRDYAQLPTPDFRATARTVVAIAQASQAAALRTVVAASTVTQGVAHHWAGTNMCPRCGREVEAWWHRFSQCPAMQHICKPMGSPLPRGPDNPCPLARSLAMT